MVRNNPNNPNLARFYKSIYLSIFLEKNTFSKTGKIGVIGVVAFSKKIDLKRNSFKSLRMRSKTESRYIVGISSSRRSEAYNSAAKRS
jgi:hypothetical protein